MITIEWVDGYCITCDECAHNGMFNLKADYIGPLGCDTYKCRYVDFSKADCIADFVSYLRKLGKPV